MKKSVVLPFGTTLVMLASAACSDSSGPLLLLDRKVVFTATSSLQPSTHDIYAIRADGVGLVKLTHDLADALNPRWSPDGSQIAFISDKNGPYEAWVMERDGSGAHTISRPNAYCSAPIRLSWSRGGDRILEDCENVEQFVINLADGSYYSLTQRWGNVADNPDWSPIDDRILYLRGPNVSVSNLDGSDTHVVAQNADRGAWSPDGKRVAFIRLNQNQSQVIFVTNVDGTNEHQVTFPPNGTVSDDAPAWSPDGSRIVFWRVGTEEARGQPHLVVMNADGSKARTITADTLMALRPDW